MFTLSAEGNGYDHWSGQDKRLKLAWCQVYVSKVEQCLVVDCWFSELILEKSNSVCWPRMNQALSFHQKVTNPYHCKLENCSSGVQQLSLFHSSNKKHQMSCDHYALWGSLISTLIETFTS